MDDRFFMGEALKQAESALSRGEFPVGCVLVKNDAVIARGARSGTAHGMANEVDHAEIMALRNLANLALDNAERSVSLYCTLEPCLMCYGAILLSRVVGRIIYAYEDVMGGGTSCSLEDLPPLYNASAVKIVPDIRRNESINLFKSYFKNPENHYWKGSLLFRYTLEQ